MRLRRCVVGVRRAPYGVVALRQRAGRPALRDGRHPVRVGGRQREGGTRLCGLGRSGVLRRSREGPPGPSPTGLLCLLSLCLTLVGLRGPGVGRREGRKRALVPAAGTRLPALGLLRHALRRHGLPALRPAAPALRTLGRRHHGAFGGSRGS